MSDTVNQNEVTDRTNEVTTDESELTVPDLTVSESNTEIVCDDPIDENSSDKRERINYEVVFFARYNNGRPSTDEITKFFNNYGVVHHVNCPEGRNNAFIFMSTLSTTVLHRRTRTTINQIRNDMTPENNFHITVASSNRPVQRQSNQIQPQSNQNHGSNQYHQNHGSYQPRWRNYNSNRGQTLGGESRDQNNYGYRHNNTSRNYRGNSIRHSNNPNSMNQYNRNSNLMNQYNGSNDNGNYGRQPRTINNSRRGRYQYNSNVTDENTNQRSVSEPSQIRNTSDSIRRNTWRQIRQE